MELDLDSGLQTQVRRIGTTKEYSVEMDLWQETPSVYWKRICKAKPLALAEWGWASIERIHLILPELPLYSNKKQSGPHWRGSMLTYICGEVRKQSSKVASSGVTLPERASWHHNPSASWYLSQFPHLWNGDNNSNYLVRLLWGLNEIMFAKHSAHVLASSKHSVILRRQQERPRQKENVCVLTSVFMCL